MRPSHILPLLLLAACKNKGDTGDAPLGMILLQDGITYAGAAVIDVTPEIKETFTDLNGDGTFDGCLDDPAAAGEDCDEPFDDVDGDGHFDAVFIAGYGPMRPALAVNDPITVRSLVIAQDGEYFAFVALDLVGLTATRIHPARDALVADGFDMDRLVVASIHNHQGPDTMGLWGDPEGSPPTTGIDPAYQEQITAAIEQAVREAAATMQAVDLTVGAVKMRDQDPYFNGAAFGGGNPTHKMHGMINDIRDPVVVSDQLLVLQGQGEGGTVFTLTSWSGHPEVWGDRNNKLSTDWVGVARANIEAQYGGVAIHLPECLGGMQSAGGGDLPLVQEDGTHVYQSCSAEDVANPDDGECYGLSVGDPRVDGDGLPVPQWAEDETWDFVVSHGWHIAEATGAALAQGETTTADPIQVQVADYYVPITNLGFQLMASMDIIDMPLDDGVTDETLCPEAADVDLGCLAHRTFRVTIGPMGFITANGELLPELGWGLPEDDSLWSTEAADASARGSTSRYFPQHDNDCDAVAWSECRDTDEVGDCDCLSMHAVPFTIHSDPGVVPVLDLLDTKYKAVISIADNYGGYIIPEPDYNTFVWLMTDDGDHYEETVSTSYTFGSKLLEAQAGLGTGR